jgi:hypothetical protein
MCKYCEKDETLLQKDEIISDMSFGWGNDEVKINRSQCIEYSLSVFVDRGYLRLADPEDCGCLDHGQKVRINYCPMCGEAL